MDTRKAGLVAARLPFAVDKVAPVDPALLAEFATECGLDQPYRAEVSLKGDVAALVHEFRQPFLLIGRRGGSDLLLDHWLVSRRHAYLQLIDGRFYCVDLGSRTGTHGGDATERGGWMDPDRAIQIGPYSVRLTLPPVSSAAIDPTSPIVTWTIPDREGGSAQWTMNRGLALVGKSPACKIRLTGADISRFHCGLVLTARGVWMIDLLCQRPVLVNGQSVRFARIHPGDALRIGDQTLTAQYDLPRSDPQFTQISSGWPGERSSAPTIPDRSGAAVDHLPALMPTVLIPPQIWSTPGSMSTGEVAAMPGVDPTVNLLVQQFGVMQQQMFDQFHQTMMMMFEGFATLHRETSGSIRQEFEEVRKLSQEIESLREETTRLAEATTMSFQAPAFFKADQHHRQTTPLDDPVGVPASTPEQPGKAPPKVVPPLPDPHVDIHARLCERLNSIAAERQSRWQKILAMMAKA